MGLHSAGPQGPKKRLGIPNDCGGHSPYGSTAHRQPGGKARSNAARGPIRTRPARTKAPPGGPDGAFARFSYVSLPDRYWQTPSRVPVPAAAHVIVFGVHIEQAPEAQVVVLQKPVHLPVPL